MEENNYLRLAAYIDTEGSITVVRKKSSRGCYRLGVRITNTDPRLPLWCKQTFGGGVYPVSKDIGNFDKFVWWANGPVAASLLKKCLPHFLLKREEAELAIAFQQTINTSGKRLSEDLILHRESIVNRLTVLHKTRPNIEAIA